MMANHQTQACFDQAAPPPSMHALAGQHDNTPLTRVALAFMDQRINVYLRFGNPARTLQLDRWRSRAVFLPASIFCRIRWESNDYGTTRWQLMVMQACTPWDAVAPQHVCTVDRELRIDGVPVAALLLADRMGRPLPSWQQCRRLTDGELFLLSTTQPASFDSRYFGPIQASAVLGTAQPIRLEQRP